MTPIKVQPAVQPVAAIVPVNKGAFRPPPGQSRTSPSHPCRRNFSCADIIWRFGAWAKPDLIHFRIVLPHHRHPKGIRPQKFKWEGLSVVVHRIDRKTESELFEIAHALYLLRS